MMRLPSWVARLPMRNNTALRAGLLPRKAEGRLQSRPERMETMITVKVTYNDGDYIISRINATLEEARKYYGIGKWHNVGDGPRDCYKRCESVELV